MNSMKSQQNPCQKPKILQEVAVSPEPGQMCQQKQAETLDEKLAVSLAHVLKTTAHYDIMESGTQNIFRVSVEKISPLIRDNVFYIVAGPPGVACKCCKGTGVANG